MPGHPVGIPGTTCFGLVVERVTGETLARTLEKRIFERLKLHATSFEPRSHQPRTSTLRMDTRAGSDIVQATMEPQVVAVQSRVHGGFRHIAGAVNAQAAGLFRASPSLVMMCSVIACHSRVQSRSDDGRDGRGRQLVIPRYLASAAPRAWTRQAAASCRPHLSAPRSLRHWRGARAVPLAA